MLIEVLIYLVIEITFIVIIDIKLHVTQRLHLVCGSHLAFKYVGNSMFFVIVPILFGV